MKENDEKLKEMLTNEKVPEQLSPDNIKIMLDAKAPKKKRSGISVVGRITAGAAACAVIAGSYAGAAHMMKNRPGKSGESSVVTTQNGEKQSGSGSKTSENKAYMVGAEDYSEIYAIMKKASENYDKNKQGTRVYGTYTNGDIVEEADEAYVKSEESVAVPSGMGGGEDIPEHSDTFNQEEDVLEADITKTDGKNIYYIYNDYEHMSGKFSGGTPSMNIASVKDGKFTGSKTIDLTPDLDSEYIEVTVYDMYLYNDMIEVIGHVNNRPVYYYDDYYTNDEPWYEFKDDEEDTKQKQEEIDYTFVSVYSKGDTPKLIGTYYQDGSYSDVRISPDGYMYLISSYSSAYFDVVEDEEDVKQYIPACGIGYDVECLPPEDILLPDDDIEPVKLLNYTVIGSIDLNEKGSFEEVETKALAGFTGNIYSSKDNIYAACGWQDTDITRIAISEGSITPEASATVEGFVNDQFSMSEYDGYFRVATTINKWEDRNTMFSSMFGTYRDPKHEHSNSLYVLDMDMEVVGSVTGFGADENIKSVNFNGDMGYVVTYEQTDPLFAIDISDPTDPFITDKFKINGYSTYMQKWDDGLLLGFGVDADSNAIETGVKIVMFDNSDPYDLKEVGFEALNRSEHSWLSSQAVYDRKALLIAPEKNLIGFPVRIYEYEEEKEDMRYVFYSYEDGEFVKQGDIKYDTDDETGQDIGFDRAVYIGGYVYALSSSAFVSASIDGFDVIDIAKF